jgi:hypothetical protein
LFAVTRDARLAGAMVRTGTNATFLRTERVDRVVVHGIEARGEQHRAEEEAAPLHPGDHEG